MLCLDNLTLYFLQVPAFAKIIVSVVDGWNVSMEDYWNDRRKTKHVEKSLC